MAVAVGGRRRKRTRLSGEHCPLDRLYERYGLRLPLINGFDTQNDWHLQVFASEDNGLKRSLVNQVSRIRFFENLQTLRVCLRF